MITRITSIYGLKITQNKMKRILFIMFGAAAISMTLAFGRTYIFIMGKLLTGEMTEDDLETLEGREQIKKVMRGEIADKNLDENFKSMSRDMIKGSGSVGGIFSRVKNLFNFRRKK